MFTAVTIKYNTYTDILSETLNHWFSNHSQISASPELWHQNADNIGIKLHTPAWLCLIERVCCATCHLFIFFISTWKIIIIYPVSPVIVVHCGPRMPSFNFYARQRSYSAYIHGNSVCLSVCLSVHLSHGWISQKRLKLGSRNFHHTVAPPL